MKCLRCKRQFIFDPKKHYNGSKSITDPYFIKCIDKLSRSGTYRYTEDELYCFIAQQSKPSTVGCLIGAIVISVFLTAFLHALIKSGLTPAFFILPIFIFTAVIMGRKILSRRRWNKFLKHWQKQSAKKKDEPDYLANMLTTRQLLEKPPSANEPDIYDYGAAKLLICEHDVQVDWLITNKFHTENGVVIISENFYPTYLKQQVKELIDANPDLEIYALHNTGKTGDDMINRLRSPLNEWKLNQQTITDLGLNHEHLLKTKLNKKIIDQFNDKFPPHAIPYHQFNPMLNHCMVNGVAIAAAYTALNANSDSGVSCDFG